MTFRKYLVLLAIVVFGVSGDTLLARGMKEVGPVHFSQWTHLSYALLNPYVVLGVLLLLGFFACYLAALSFADLTYVLPATAVGYVVLALAAHYYLHEQISVLRSMGILLITIGVGFVATGPELTRHEHRHHGRVEECRLPEHVGTESGDSA